MTHPLDRQGRKPEKPRISHRYTATDTGLISKGGDMPNAFFLAGPSLRSLVFNFAELTKLALLPVFFVAVIVLCRIIAVAKNNTVLEPTFNGLVGVGVFMLLLTIIAVLPAVALIQLRSARSEVAYFWDEFIIGLPMTGRFLMVTIVSNLSAAAGLLLFIVPGLYALQRFSLAPYYVADREMGVREAMSAAAADARKFSRPMWQLATLNAIAMGITLVPVFGAIISTAIRLIYVNAGAIRYVEISQRELPDR